MKSIAHDAKRKSKIRPSLFKNQNPPRRKNQELQRRFSLPELHMFRNPATESLPEPLTAPLCEDEGFIIASIARSFPSRRKLT